MAGIPLDRAPHSPEQHFAFHFSAAVRMLRERLLDPAGLGAAELPFLAGYYEQLDAAALGPGEDALRRWEDASSVRLPLRALRDAAGLEDDAATLLFLVGLVAEDPRFATVFRALQRGEARPTVGLLAGLGPRGALTHLHALGLVDVANPSDARSDWALEPAPLPWAALLGEPPDGLEGWCRFRPPHELVPLDELILPHAARTRLAQAPIVLAAGTAGTLVVRGPSAGGRRTAAGAVARALSLGTLEVTGLVEADDPRWRLCGLLATLLGAMPVAVLEPAPGETLEPPALPAHAGPLAAVLERQGGLAGSWAERSIAVELDPPGAAERLAHWRDALAGHEAHGLDPLASRLRMTGGNIRRAAGRAVAEAALAGRTAILPADVRRAARQLSRERLETLTTPVEADGEWAELAVTADTRRELELLESRCRHRESIGTGRGARGVRALFSGPSGTGKTLAARLLASALDLDLYRLDLSTVVNKYLGETEKNLSAILARAEELDVVLLLDEGDALLTRRTDVQTSNDRYANLETNYLLQRLETFEGVLVVTTNAGDRIDGAFRRRLDVVVEFRAPDAGERWAIWQLHLPPGHTVPDALLQDVSSRCALTGGQIRNGVAHALLLALTDDTPLGAGHVEEAVRREYRKAGAVCPLRPARARSHAA